MIHLPGLFWQLPFLIISRAISQKTLKFYLGMTVLSTTWRQGSSWNSPFESNQALLHRWLHTYPSSKTQVLHLLQTTGDSSTWPGSFASSWQGGTCDWQTQTQRSSQDTKRRHVQITATHPGHWTSCEQAGWRTTKAQDLSHPSPKTGVAQAPSWQMLSPLPLMTMLQPSPKTTSLGPPKQPVHTVLFHRIFLLLGL